MSANRSRTRHTRQRWTAAAVGAISLLTALPATARAGESTPGPAAQTGRAAEAAACGTSGRTYVTNASGELLQYTMPTPLTGSTFSAYVKVGAGWGSYGKVLAGPDGDFFAFKSDGTYYAHRADNGTWDVSPKRISTYLGWLGNAADHGQATVDRSGRLWVADNLGQLYGYQYDPKLGTGGGLSSIGIVDNDWDRYNLITAGDTGVLYGRAADGRLYRSRYDVASQRWIERHVLIGAAAWGNFTSITAGGGDTLVAVRTNGEALYYRYDELTDTWPVVAKPVAAGGWHTFGNVTSRPDNCRLLTNHTPPKPPPLPMDHPAATVTQSTSGYLDILQSFSGHIAHVRVDPVTFSNPRWTRLDEPRGVSGRPAVVKQSDGRISVFAQGVHGSVFQRDQVAKDSPGWEAWNDLAGAMAHPPVVAKLPASGLAVQYAVDVNGKPWHRVQIKPDAGFLGWKPLAGPALDGPLTTVDEQGGIRLFGRKTDGTLATALFSAAGTMSPWVSLGSQQIVGLPAVITLPGTGYRVVARDLDGRVVTTRQTAIGGAYEPWSAIPNTATTGATPPAPVAPLSASSSPTAVFTGQTPGPEIVVRGNDGHLYRTAGTSATTWSPWVRFGPKSEEPRGNAIGDPRAFTYSAELSDTWGVVHRDDLGRTHISRPTTGTGWTSTPIS
ncbi:tachylectin-related carbohydrate-binding protein [Streptomyces sp. NPDC020965]|uniref:tachylectin-related carbohydrate-binding protein n=1 Tax=Streptomyces sp. NPDC020965 TaxID=3365105 RepID=UPI003790AA0C